MANANRLTPLAVVFDWADAMRNLQVPPHATWIWRSSRSRANDRSTSNGGFALLTRQRWREIPEQMVPILNHGLLPVNDDRDRDSAVVGPAQLRRRPLTRPGERP